MLQFVYIVIRGKPMLQNTENTDVPIPRFLYGTAWKENETQRLTELALRQGFRGIDTANQRRHYHEGAVGQAIAEAIESGLVVRDDLFLQTKFTFQSGQDHRLPYDPAASVSTQVDQSFISSLEHLRVEFIDTSRHAERNLPKACRIGCMLMISSLLVSYANTPKEQTRPVTAVGENERLAMQAEYPGAETDRRWQETRQ